MNKVKSFFMPTIISLIKVIFYSFSVKTQSIRILHGTYQWKVFATKELSKSKPTILIYFALNCEHSQVLIKGLLKKDQCILKARNYIVCFESLMQVNNFEKDYGLKSYAYA
jgi:hypothetical protein